jgi:hypothetical protein
MEYALFSVTMIGCQYSDTTVVQRQSHDYHCCVATILQTILWIQLFGQSFIHRVTTGLAIGMVWTWTGMT